MANKEAEQVLLQARARIERGWSRWNYAETVNGEAVDPNSANAVAWCISGAIRNSRGTESEKQAAYREFAQAAGCHGIQRWNSMADAKLALITMDRAIQRAQRPDEQKKDYRQRNFD